MRQQTIILFRINWRSQDTKKTGYFYNNPTSNGLEIADIIGDHDTRLLPASDNGKIVRTADLLWRVTYPHAQIYMPDENPELSLQRVNETCLSKDLLHHLGDIGEKIARLEFVNMMNYKFSEKAHPLLQLNFPEELEQILTSNQFPYKQH